MIPLPLIVHRGAAAVALVLCMASLPTGSAKELLDLAGTWHCQLDRGNTGATERWFAHPLTTAIELPGSLPGSGIGDPVSVATKWTGSIFNKSYFTAPEYAAYRRPGTIQVPVWLQPDTYYVGAAWFQREVGIPAAWDLPFLCADVTARSLRVAEGAAREHPNGATGVARIVVGVSDVAGSASRYEALLGVARRRGAQSEAVEFALGSTTIALIAAGGDGRGRSGSNCCRTSARASIL